VSKRAPTRRGPGRTDSLGRCCSGSQLRQRGNGRRVAPPTPPEALTPSGGSRRSPRPHRHDLRCDARAPPPPLTAASAPHWWLATHIRRRRRSGCGMSPLYRSACARGHVWPPACTQLRGRTSGWRTSGPPLHTSAGGGECATAVGSSPPSRRPPPRPPAVAPADPPGDWRSARRSHGCTSGGGCHCPWRCPSARGDLTTVPDGRGLLPFPHCPHGAAAGTTLAVANPMGAPTYLLGSLPLAG